MPSLWVTEPTGQLVPLEREGYATESDFQQLLAENPAVLAGALEDGGEPGRWLLVDQELPIKAEESESGSWRLDHLFIGSDARPTLVEVKRSSDPRLRREVVAQMLDYAASFTIDWSAETLRERWLNPRYATPGADRVAELEELLAVAGLEEDEFWSAVQTNIDAGKLRLLFVADHLPATLTRIIEFLNGQLNNAEVLGVEVARHVAGDGNALVAYQPVVHGRSSPGATRKTAAIRRSEEEFWDTLREAQGQEVVNAAAQLVTGAKKRGARVTIGTSVRSPKLFLNLDTKGTGRTYWPLVLDPRPGKLSLFLRYLRNHPAFEDDAVRAEFVERMSSAAGTTVLGDNLDGLPSLPVTCLTEDGVVQRVLSTLDWVIQVADGGS